jgi:hypothetical protein
MTALSPAATEPAKTRKRSNANQSRQPKSKTEKQKPVDKFKSTMAFRVGVHKLLGSVAAHVGMDRSELAEKLIISGLKGNGYRDLFKMLSPLHPDLKDDCYIEEAPNGRPQEPASQASPDEDTNRPNE